MAKISNIFLAFAQLDFTNCIEYMACMYDLLGVEFAPQFFLVLNFRAMVAKKLQFDTLVNLIPVFHSDYWQCDWIEHCGRRKMNSDIKSGFKITKH